MPYGLAHEFHLVVSALVYGDLQPGVSSVPADQPHFCPRRAASVDDHAFPQALHTTGGRCPPHQHPVYFGDLKARVSQAVRQFAVVGHEYQSAGVVVQPAHRENPDRCR